MVVKCKQMLKDLWTRWLIRSVDIPSIDDFDEKDMKLIEDWLYMSSGHRGFYAYLKARDRAIAQTLVNLDVDRREDRKQYHQLTGRRLEALRLKERAERVKKKRDS